MAKIKRTEQIRPKRGRGPRPVEGGVWLYGHHVVEMALRNPRRRIRRLVATREAAGALAGIRPGVEPAILDRRALERELPAGAVHQGVALLADPLEQPELESLLAGLPGEATIVVLDQVTDPHNVGAILRSAAVFDAAAVLTPRRHAPLETAALAKSASGALEHVPLIAASNLDRALQRLKEAGFWCIGLDAAAEAPIAAARLDGRIALVLGAEGAGLRRLTARECDLLVRLPTPGPIDSLNVSNAAAVALYAVSLARAAHVEKAE
jgi:23S rRNA (guanosine2251-2'-O)-methyltransferase